MTSNKVLWPKVFGIAAIQAAMTLAWVIYSLYLANLLVNTFGFSKEFAATILIFENAIDAFIEPAFGAFSDRQQQRTGSNISLITVAVIASSVLFISLPVLATLIPPQSAGRWLLPVVAVLWATAMSVFRAPVISLLGQVAPASQLPQAASILTLVGQLVASCRFDAYGVIVGMGANFAFFLGSVVLLAAMASLRWVYPVHLLPAQERGRQSIPWSNLGFLVGIGLSLATALRFLFPAISQTFGAQLGAENLKLAMTGFFILVGLTAWPAGQFSLKIGNYPVMLWGLLLTVGSLIIFVFGHNFGIFILSLPPLILGLSLVLNSVLPLVINLIPSSHTGIGIGTYLGSTLAAAAVFDWCTMTLGAVTPLVGAIGGAAALLSTYVWVISSKASLLSYAHSSY